MSEKERNADPLVREFCERIYAHDVEALTIAVHAVGRALGVLTLEDSEIVLIESEGKIPADVYRAYARLYKKILVRLTEVYGELAEIYDEAEPDEGE